jgi:putative sterol carrier protein
MATPGSNAGASSGARAGARRPKPTARPVTAAAISQATPAQLVELLEALDPADKTLLDLDIDVIGAAIDPRKLNSDQFVRLLSAIDRLARAGADIDLSKMRAGTFARIIAKASSAQVEGIMVRPELRARILGEIFRRMSEHFRTDRAASTRAVVHWRLTGGSGAGGYDRYETVIDNGTCTVTAEPTRDPRVTITIHPAEFLKLITRNASGPVLFMTGKLKIKGDLAFAAGLTSLFDLPRAS